MQRWVGKQLRGPKLHNLVALSIPPKHGWAIADSAHPTLTPLQNKLDSLNLKLHSFLNLEQKKRTKALELSFTAFFLHTTGFDKNLRVVAPLCSEITCKTSFLKFPLRNFLVIFLESPKILLDVWSNSRRLEIVCFESTNG